MLNLHGILGFARKRDTVCHGKTVRHCRKIKTVYLQVSSMGRPRCQDRKCIQKVLNKIGYTLPVEVRFRQQNNTIRVKKKNIRVLIKITTLRNKIVRLGRGNKTTW